MKTVRGTIREQTEHSGLRVVPGWLVGFLNRLGPGLRPYFSIGSSMAGLAQLDRYVRLRPPLIVGGIGPADGCLRWSFGSLRNRL